VHVAHGPPARRSACLRRARAAAALDRNSRVWPLRESGGRATPVRLSRRAHQFLPAAAERGHVSAHRLLELPVHGDRGSHRTTALRLGATRQTGPGIRQYALRYRTSETSAGEPRGHRWHSFDCSPTATCRKYERGETCSGHHVF